MQVIALVGAFVIPIAAVALLQVPYLQAAGAVMLYIIAVKLLIDNANSDEPHSIKRSATLAGAIQTIVAADFVMSLDKVLGIVLSIPLIIWGSRLVTALLTKVPQLVYLGAGLLGFAAGEMLVHDPGLDALLFHGNATAADALPVISVPFVILCYLLMRRA